MVEDVEVALIQVRYDPQGQLAVQLFPCPLFVLLLLDLPLQGQIVDLILLFLRRIVDYWRLYLELWEQGLLALARLLE